MATNPFQTWWRVKQQIDLLLTVHNKFPRIIKRAKGIMPKTQLRGTIKLGDKTEKIITNCDKKKEQAINKFGKSLKPRAKEVRDSIKIMKVVMKADFPKEYKRVFGKK